MSHIKPETPWNAMKHLITLRTKRAEAMEEYIGLDQSDRLL